MTASQETIKGKIKAALRDQGFRLDAYGTIKARPHPSKATVRRLHRTDRSERLKKEHDFVHASFE